MHDMKSITELLNLDVKKYWERLDQADTIAVLDLIFYIQLEAAEWK